MERQLTTSPEVYARSIGSQRRIVLIGHGIESERLSRAVGNRKVDVLVVEPDPTKAASARAAGYRVIEGNPKDPAVLRRARVGDAAIVAVTALEVDESVVRTVRAHRPTGLILTNLPTGFSDMNRLDPGSVMISRIVSILDHDKPAD